MHVEGTINPPQRFPWRRELPLVSGLVDRFPFRLSNRILLPGYKTYLEPINDFIVVTHERWSDAVVFASKIENPVSILHLLRRCRNVLPVPELPEVKTIQDQLNRCMPFRIARVRQSGVAASIVHTPLVGLAGRTLTHIDRVGKLLDFRIDDGRHLLSHLGMSGAWLISDQRIFEKHIHVHFQGEPPTGEHHLAYVDSRRFGHMYLYSAEQAAAKFQQLGHDLLSPRFTLKYFTDSLLKYPQRMIKVTLLDQSLFAGTGNYIANEICAHGGVLPHRTVATLSRTEINRLYQGIFKVLDPTLEHGGTAFGGGYRDAKGERGNGVQHLVVFYQATCQRCRQTPVIKTILAQRGTYHCPRCQR